MEEFCSSGFFTCDERMSQASGKQDVEQLMKEVQEARRIKMLHQPSKVYMKYYPHSVSPRIGFLLIFFNFIKLF
ncbi:unnamed protein product [Lathyrus sativus]|nr:unnamed protein product [Lathyrus sativus]